MASTMLITGGGRGIGAATARMAAARGYRVAINYRRDEASARRVVDAIRDNGGQACLIQADIAEAAEIRSMFETVDDYADELDGLDVLINNAGIVDVPCELADMSAERIEYMMRVNVVGAMVCAREAIRRMSRARGGRGGTIVNVSSAASHAGGRGGAGTYVDYGASKGAIDTLTEGLSHEVAAQGIRVNAVWPGVVDTTIHASGGQPDKPRHAPAKIPLGRIGQPEDIAEAILYLADAPFTTGALLDVDGGV